MDSVRREAQATRRHGLGSLLPTQHRIRSPEPSVNSVFKPGYLPTDASPPDSSLPFSLQGSAGGSSPTWRCSNPTFPLKPVLTVLVVQQT